MAQPRPKRTPLQLPVSLGGQRAHCADVSALGCCLESATPLHVGETLEGEVHFGSKALAWRGRVRWARPSSPMASTWHRAGVTFSWVSVGLRALLSLAQRGRGR
jgi:PilZ domain